MSSLIADLVSRLGNPAPKSDYTYHYRFNYDKTLTLLNTKTDKLTKLGSFKDNKIALNAAQNHYNKAVTFAKRLNREIPQVFYDII